MNNLLDQLKDKIRSKISELNYNTWFKPIIDARVKDGGLCLVVPNRFIADWIGDYYSDLLSEEVSSLLGGDHRLSFEISEEAWNKIKSRCETAGQETGVTPESLRVKTVEKLNTKFTFDKFVVGSSNQFAHAACKAVADLPGGHYNPLFIYGGVGLGKTHLLHAIGIQILRNRPGAQLLYMSAEKFMNELINSLRYEKMHEFRTKFRDRCDILLIDDVQFIGGKERTQEEFFHTFNALHESQRQIVVTSDKLPRDIPGLEERLRSRFEWGLIADIQPPDLETRIAILKKKAEASSLKCPDDVAMFLASSIISNVRELEGSLIRLNAFASLTGTAISVDLAREVLGNTLLRQERSCSIESIQKVVASYFKINISDLKSPKRVKSLAFPRQIAMYLCKKHVNSSFPEIGGKFGGKDHTTVMYACRKIEKLIEADCNLKSEVTIIERSIFN
jgi:chromosomal replication initiator protein